MQSNMELSKIITAEIRDVLSRVDENEIQPLIKAIMDSDKVFVFAVGRVYLSLQCMAKRLAHLGIDVQLVGSITEKPIHANDLLILASGSGESKLPVQIAIIARHYGAKLALITSARESTIKSMADVVVHLPCPTKNDAAGGVTSIQSLSTLFDQSLHLFGDVICMMIQTGKKLSNEELWARHANLE